MKKITEIHCSKLSRPLTCAGSLQFDEKFESNEAAKEGTAAGQYLERLLLGLPEHHTASNGVIFDDDMKFYTGEIAKEILSNTQSLVLCEEKIDWQTRSGIWIKGKYDASFIRDGKLYIDDLKYGWNIVEVKENWQLLGYAIGEIIRRGQAFTSIVLRIHQPRPHHEDGATREWRITYDELLEYKERIEKRMDEIAAGDVSLVTSSKCKYCPGAAESCVAFNRSLYAGIDHTLTEFKVDSLNEKDISEQLKLMDRVAEIFKIKQDSLKQLAINRIKEGKLIPDYATIEQYGNRDWKSGVTAESIKVLTGVDITRKEMMSPAQAEKAGVPKDLVSFYVDRYFKGFNLKRQDANAIGSKIFGGK
jgi:hypothetical protein